MATHPIGRGKVNLSINMPTAMKARLAALAQANGMKLGEFCRAVLEDALVRGVRVETETRLVSMDGQPPGPRIRPERARVLVP